MRTRIVYGCVLSILLVVLMPFSASASLSPICKLMRSEALLKDNSFLNIDLSETIKRYMVAFKAINVSKALLLFLLVLLLIIQVTWNPLIQLQVFLASMVSILVIGGGITLVIFLLLKTISNNTSTAYIFEH